MILAYVSNEPCPKCGQRGKYGRVHVTGNRLLRGCNACGHKEFVPLPRLRKRVIYLDQHFLSHAFRRKIQPFVDAANKIQYLAAKQMVVCPWSEVHEIESHIWGDTRAADLWKFIKRSARGRQFHPPTDVRCNQIRRLFALFNNGQPPSNTVFREDALDHQIDDWDNYSWIDVGRFVEDPCEVRSRKERNVRQLTSLMRQWQSKPSTFDADMLEEATSYAEG